MAYGGLPGQTPLARNRVFELSPRRRKSCSHNKKALRRSRRRAHFRETSGRLDLNQRLPAPKAGALARLSYAPASSLRPRAPRARDAAIRRKRFCRVNVGRPRGITRPRRTVQPAQPKSQVSASASRSRSQAIVVFTPCSYDMVDFQPSSLRAFSALKKQRRPMSQTA